MKTTKLTLLFCFAIVLFSCKKEVTYSCDPSTNEWAKENIEEIRQMSRENFIKLPIEKMQAAYRVFDKTKRINAWKIKFNELLTNEWNDDERQHIEELAKFMELHQDWFGEVSPTRAQKINDEISLFAYSWIDYAKETLGWNETEIFEIAGTPTPMSKIGTLRPDFGTINGGGGIRPKCTCRTDWAGCGSTQSCILGKNDCKDDGLKGCGLLWLQSCDGMC